MNPGIFGGDHRLPDFICLNSVLNCIKATPHKDPLIIAGRDMVRAC